ncbi:MAG: shikimate kinase [Saprospiraceae bacterium]
MDKTCFLIGFMGSGKTYWGTRLAERLGVPFVDLDDRIEVAEQRSIETIFQQNGEAVFRQMERNALHKLSLEQPSVVATGGGTPCFFDNMDWMNGQGTTVFLDTPVPVLSARLRADPKTRPLLTGISSEQMEAHISRLLKQRMPFYQIATVVVAGSDLLDLGELVQLVVGRKRSQR